METCMRVNYIQPRCTLTVEIMQMWAISTQLVSSSCQSCTRNLKKLQNCKTMLHDASGSLGNRQG